MSLDIFLIDRNNYINEIKLGEGSFGEVYLAHHINNKDDKVAIKYISIDDPCDSQTQKYFIREITIMSDLDHPNILKLIGFSLPSRENQNFAIYSKYIPNKTLHEVILRDQNRCKSKKILNPTRLSKIVYGIASAMKYLHLKGIVHRDLKPQNIFLDENYLPIISDFGLSRFVSDDLQMTRRLGTPYYMAPEMLTEDGITTNKIDVYAFAVNLLFLFTTTFQFNNPGKLTLNSFIKKIINGNRFIIPKNVPEFYVSLINRCWSNSPDSRPSFDEIVKEFESNPDFIFEGLNEKEVHNYMCEMNKLKTKNNNENYSDYEEETEEFDFNI